MADSIERIADEVATYQAPPNGQYIQVHPRVMRDWESRLRALSPAVGDLHHAVWSMVRPYIQPAAREKVNAALKEMLAASPQQEPGAPHWGNLPDGFDDPELYPPTPADESGAGLVGIASIPPGGDGATTRALFDARTVPPGTKLYASGQTLAGAGGDELCFTCRNPKHEGPCGEPQWGSPKMCDKLLARALAAEKKLTATSAGTTGDDSARLDWLLSRIPDTVLLFHGAAVDEGWPDKSPSRKGIDAARRARGEG